MRQGLRITIYVDEAGDPTGESYLKALGPTANRLGDAGLRALNEAAPHGVIHEALVAALDGAVAQQDVDPLSQLDDEVAHALVEMTRLALTGHPQDPAMYAGRLCHRFRDRHPDLARQLAAVSNDAGVEFSPLRDGG